MCEWLKVITAIMSFLINIVYSSFAGCSGITTLTLPEGITSIGDEAFYRVYFQ